MIKKASFTLRFPRTEKPAKKPRISNTTTVAATLAVPAGINPGAISSAYIKKSTAQTTVTHALSKTWRDDMLIWEIPDEDSQSLEPHPQMEYQLGNCPSGVHLQRSSN